MKLPKFDAESRKKLLVIGIILVIVCIAFVIASYFVGRYRMTKYGYDTSEDAIKAYMHGLADHKQYEIENSLYPNGTAYEDYVEISMAISDMITDDFYLDCENMEMISTTIEDLTEYNEASVNKSIVITSATSTTVSLPMTRTVDEQKFEFSCPIVFVTVEVNSKWYIVQASLDAFLQTISIEEEEFILNVYGNDEFGYFSIPASWVESYLSQGDYPDYARMYTAPSNRAYISTSLYSPSKSIDAIADDLINEASLNLNIIDGPSIDANDVDGQHIVIISIIYSDEETGTEYVYLARLISSPMHDNNIHVMELMGKADTIETAIPYLQSFTLTAPVMDSVEIHPFGTEDTESVEQ